jgi:superoxide oxidase
MRVPMPLVGLDFPALVGANAEWVARLVPLHETLARAFYLVIAAHVAAALWHHFIRRDDTLRRMTPRRRMREPSASHIRPHST